MIKEKVQEEFDKQTALSDSLLSKIQAEHEIIQNMSEYCEEIKQSIDTTDFFDIASGFRYILKMYTNLQNEIYSLGVISEIDENIKTDYNLKMTEYNELITNIAVGRFYEIKKNDYYYLFFPYTFETTKLCIIIESKVPIIQEERFIILNILKELEEQLLTIFYIESIEETIYNGKHRGELDGMYPNKK